MDIQTLYDAELLLQFVSDRQWQKAKEQYHIGQAVIARILQSNRDDNKCLVSLRMQECYQGNTEVDLVEDYLMALDKIGMLNDEGVVFIFDNWCSLDILELAFKWDISCTQILWFF